MMSALTNENSLSSHSFVTQAQAPISEIDKILGAMTIAQEKELAAREKADQGTNAVMSAMFHHTLTQAEEIHVLKTRISALESEKKQSDTAHNIAMQALESRHQTEMKAVQAKVDDLEKFQQVLTLETDAEHRTRRIKSTFKKYSGGVNAVGSGL